MKYTKAQIKRHIRRWLLIIFKPKYVMASLSQRKGKCNNCGCCSSHSGCPYFREKANCLKWNNMPFICKLYPLDEKDKAPFTKTMCGFYWGKKSI